MARVFLSHAVKDQELVEEFVDLLDAGIGVEPGDVFCSSLPGMGIPAGTSFIEYIRSQISTPSLVILIISTEFLKSDFCKHETGASWVLSLPVFPLLIPPIDYSDMGGVLSGVQSAKMNDKEKLNDLRDELIERLGLKPLSTSHWERRRDKFLNKLGKLASTAAVTPPAVPAPIGASPNSVSVSNSGNLVKLGDHFFQTSAFEHRGSSDIFLSIVSTSASDDAALARLRPDPNGFRQQGEIPYSHKNEGGFVRVVKISSRANGEETDWQLELTAIPNNADSMLSSGINLDGTSYGAADIAELRAARILFDDAPKPGRDKRFGNSLAESFIFGSDRSGVSTQKNILREFVTTHGKSESSLKKARLECVFTILASAIAHHVLELTLTPNDESSIHVRFKGQRNSVNHGQSPDEILVEGVCKL